MKMAWDSEMDHVRSWVLKGDYDTDIETSFDRPLSNSTIATGLSEAKVPQIKENDDLQARFSQNTKFITSPAQDSSQLPSQLKSLAVADDAEDPLIPTEVEIRHIYNNSLATWQNLVDQSLSLPRGTFPAGLSPSIMLQDIPPLPESLPPSGVLAGSPCFYLGPDPEPGSGSELDLQTITGQPKYFRLAYPSPIECCISSDRSTCYGNPAGTADAPNSPQGLAILTLCWGYVFSLRQLQSQNKKVHFTSYIHPISLCDVGELSQNDILIQLPKEASCRLVQWLCAVLAPNPGWAVDGIYTPWDARFTSDVRFVIATEEQVSFDSDAELPTPTEATDLLIEFCELFGIDHPIGSKSPTTLSPIKAAFLASLAIPFYRMAKLQPHLPRPWLRPGKTAPLNAEQKADIHRYTEDARYYMTLSMHPYSLGPVLWSIFWQPDIQCNLVSPWLAGIENVLELALNSCDFEMLIKIFLLRRPRVAMWWHGLFLLGNSKIMDLIRSYLATLDEGCSYDTLSRPDIVSAAWTGAPQSYQDNIVSTTYQDLTTSIPRAAILQHRHTMTLRDPWPLFYGWLPFGSIPKSAVEPDLYPWLERGHHREYRHWTWWARDDTNFEPSTHSGYRKETKRFVSSVPDNLDIITSNCSAPVPPIKLETSRRATLHMLSHSLGNMVGDRSLSNAYIPLLKQSHPWLKDWIPV